MSYYKDLVLKITEKDEKYFFQEISFPCKEDIKILSSAESNYDETIVKDELFIKLKNNPSETDFAKTGTLLWDIFPEVYQNRILNNLQEKSKQRLRLRLWIEPWELQFLPWELIYDETINKFLCFKDPFISLVHISVLEKKDIKISPLEKLKVLFVASTYGDKKLPDIPEEEIEIAKNSYEDLRDGLIDIESFTDLTVNELKEKLSEKDWHVFHFYGHGYSQGAREQSGIILKDGSLTPEELSQILSKTFIKVVLLTSCNTAVTFGYQLSRSGIPLVLAMRDQIELEAAKVLIKSFYTSLSERLSIDDVVKTVREELSREFNKTTYWSIPVLFLSHINGNIFARTDTVEAKDYLGSILKNYSYVPVPGKRIYSMDDFIPLRLYKEEYDESNNDDRKKEEESKKNSRKTKDEYGLNINDIIKDNKRIVIKGEPGAGKSTLLHNLAYEEAKKIISTDWNWIDIKYFPIFLSLREWSKDKKDFDEFLKDSYRGYKEEFYERIKDLINHGGVIILLDGLDEVTQNRREFINNLKKFSNMIDDRCIVIVTTRSSGYNYELTGWEYYKIMEFNSDERNRFIDVYFGKDSEKTKLFLEIIENSHQFKALSSNPLLLKLMCFVYEKDNLKLPEDRAKLYDRVIYFVFKEYFESRYNIFEDQVVKSEIKNHKKILSELAYKFFKEGKESFTDDEIDEILEEDKNKISLIKKLPFKSGFIELLSDDITYTFLHLTFQEYFTALALSQMNIEDSLKIIEQHLWEWDRWQEVILFLSDLLKYRCDKLAGLINMILDHHDTRPFEEAYKNPIPDKDPLRDILKLAIYCYDEKEISDREIKEELEERIIKYLKQNLQEKYIILKIDDINLSLTQLCKEEALKIFIKMFQEVSNIKVRAFAANALGYIGEKAEEILIQSLNDSDPDLKSDIIWSLGLTGSKKVEKVLIDNLLHGEEDIYCISPLVKIASPEAIDALIEALKLISDPLELHEALQWNLGFAKAGKAIIKALMDKNRDKDIRLGCIYVLSEMDPKPKEAIEPLLETLKDEDKEIHLEAAEALLSIGYETEEIIKELINEINFESKFLPFKKNFSNLCIIESEKAIKITTKYLKEGSENVREKAAAVLCNLKTENAVPILIELLKDKDLYVRIKSACALERIFSRLLKKEEDKFYFKNINLEQTVNVLIEILKDENKEVQRYIASALSNIGKTQGIIALIDAMEIDTCPFRDIAIKNLWKLPDKLNINFIIKSLNDPIPSIRMSAVEVLGNIKYDKAEEYLIKALEDENKGVVYKATESLIKKGTEKSIRHLLKIITQVDENSRFRKINLVRLFYDKPLDEELNYGRYIYENSLKALKNIPAFFNNIDLIVKAIEELEENKTWVYQDLLELIGGTNTEKTIKFLIKALEHSDEYVCRKAAEALGNIGSPVAIEPLIKALEHSNEYVCRKAAEALGNIGSPTAIEHLIKTLEHEDLDVSKQALESIEKIFKKLRKETKKLNPLVCN